MTARSKKLAWELAALFAKYGQRDIDDALYLVASGELFTTPLALARQVAQKSRGAIKGASASKARVSAQRSRQMSLDHVLNEPEVEEFVMAVIQGTRLAGPAQIRSFAELIGCDLPQKAAPRAAMARRLGKRLSEMEPGARAEALKVSEVLGDTSEQSSTLRAWSNLIVKS